MSEEKDVVSRVVDFFYTASSVKILLLITMFGAILRFLLARNISALGDEMVHGPHAIGFMHSGLFNTIFQAPLWFYLTDLSYKLLGVTMFSSRFLSFVFGTLTIILVYLIGKKIFDKKIALLASFLLASSYYIIRYTLSEMDITAAFFLLSALYFFIESREKNKFPYIAAVCIGVAALIKTLSLFFVPAFLIGFFVLNNDKNKEKIKNALIFGIIILLIFIPIIIYNYLWYQDKSMLDTYFAQYFNIGESREMYQGLAGYNSGVMFPRFFEGLFDVSTNLFKLEPLILILGLLGIILAYSRKEKRALWILLISFEISGFILMILSSWLPTHYTLFIPILCIFASFYVNDLSKKIKLNEKTFFAGFVILVLLFQFLIPPISQTPNLLSHISSQSSISQLRNYAEKSMDKNSVVLTDARIYRGRTVFMFHDFHYLESTLFDQVWTLNVNLTSKAYPVKIYFVECAKDDCGWGTVSSNPGLNTSSEELVSFFSKAGQPIKSIYCGGGYDEKSGELCYNIYQATIDFKPEIISIIDSTHEWLYYPVDYTPKEKMIDNFEVSGTLSHLLYYLAWIIFFLAVICALLIPIIVLYQLKNE